MKYLFWLLPVIIFPYIVLLALGCIFLWDGLMESLFGGSVARLTVVLMTVLLWALVSVITYILQSKKDCVRDTAHMNMLVKLIHIPAYIMIFAVGIVFLLTIFTYGISLLLIAFDLMAILLSGAIGLTAVVRGRGELGWKCTLIHGILQFIFVLDIVSAVMVYRKQKISRIVRTGSGI